MHCKRVGVGSVHGAMRKERPHHDIHALWYGDFFVADTPPSTLPSALTNKEPHAGGHAEKMPQQLRLNTSGNRAPQMRGVFSVVRHGPHIKLKV